MKELKSKKTGLVQVLSEEDYARMVNSGNIDMKRFIVTDLKGRTIIPALKVPEEVKPNKTKK